MKVETATLDAGWELLLQICTLTKGIRLVVSQLLHGNRPP
jgi:hypothetical protein